MTASRGPDTARQLQASYDQIYAERIIEETSAFCRWIFSLVQPSPAEQLLDVACGVGGFVRLARDNGIHCYGVDISQRALAIARTRGCPAILANADGETLPFLSETFEHVTCLGSLEHYLHPEVGIQEIARVMKPNGYCYIMLPNLFYWRYLLRAVIKGKGPSHGQDLERFAALEDWKVLLESNGLSVVKVVRYDGGGRVGISQWLAARVTPITLTYCFVFICKRRSSHHHV